MPGKFAVKSENNEKDSDGVSHEKKGCGQTPI